MNRPLSSREAQLPATITNRRVIYLIFSKIGMMGEIEEQVLCEDGEGIVSMIEEGSCWEERGQVTRDQRRRHCQHTSVFSPNKP